MAEEDRGLIGDAVHGAVVNSQRRAALPLVTGTRNVLAFSSLFTAGNEFPQGKLLGNTWNTITHLNADPVKDLFHSVTPQSFIGPGLLLAGAGIAEFFRWRTARRLRRG